jgi:hypothetical protein
MFQGKSVGWATLRGGASTNVIAAQVDGEEEAAPSDKVATIIGHAATLAQ